MVFEVDARKSSESERKLQLGCFIFSSKSHEMESDVPQSLQIYNHL